MPKFAQILSKKICRLPQEVGLVSDNCVTIIPIFHKRSVLLPFPPVFQCYLEVTPILLALIGLMRSVEIDDIRAQSPPGSISTPEKEQGEGGGPDNRNREEEPEIRAESVHRRRGQERRKTSTLMISQETSGHFSDCGTSPSIQQVNGFVVLVRINKMFQI